MNTNSKREKMGLLFLLPSLLGMSIFFLLPYMNLIFLSVGVSKNDVNWTIENYEKVLQNSAFQLATKNTIQFMAICIPILLVASLFIAYFVIIHIKSDKWILLGSLIPMVIPTSTTIVLWNAILDKSGFLNKILGYNIGSGVEWMDSKYAMIMLVFLFVWKNIGFSTVLWAAGMKTLPTQISDASKIDGANAMQQLFFVFCPNLDYCFLCVLSLAFINSLKIYRETYFLVGEYPNQNIYMLQNIFNNWFRDLQMSNMAVGAVIELAVIAILLFLLYKIYSRKQTR